MRERAGILEVYRITKEKWLRDEKHRLVQQYSHPILPSWPYLFSLRESLEELRVHAVRFNVALVAQWPAAGRERFLAGVAEAADFDYEIRLPGLR